MSIVLTETPEAPEIPATERRGGDEGIDWGAVRPGEEFPETEREQDDAACRLEEPDYDRGAAPLWHSCGHPLCGGT